ncbi:MAG: cupredoxin family copper-binding protein [Candidatus Nealsonbacteria bacterium]|nr:cupredoxin family copper-binding protein [Candidatus Nealsonbacteria bacterium]
MAKIIIFIIIGLVIAGAGYWYYGQPASPEQIPLIPTIETKEEAPASRIILIKNFAFNPAKITIKMGTEVVWRNEDSVPHTVTAEGIFDSRILQNGESFGYKFDSPGTFDYICAIHPNMKAQIIVE